MMRALLAALLVFALPAPGADRTPLDGLAFLIGSWEAVPGPDGARGASTFRFDVQGRVLVRTNRADYPAAGGRPASSHEDLMVVFVEGAPPAKAIYFDNEGHVIRYTVAALTPKGVTFVSEAASGQPRYRLTYTMLADDRLAGEFALAPPDAPERFKPMFSWEMRPAAARER